MRNEEKLLNKQLNEEKDNIHRWRQRAINCAPSDEEKALDCIARSQQCRKKAEALEKNISEHNQAQNEINRSIESSEQYHTEMKQKLTLMRARTSTNQALDVTLKLDNQPEIILEDTFKRWEINTTSIDSYPRYDTDQDSLEHEFSLREEKEQLKKELSALLNAENDNEK